MKLTHTTVATLAATLIIFGSLAGGANAATIVFDLTNPTRSTFTTTTQDGVTLSVTGVTSDSGAMAIDSDGIAVLGADRVFGFSVSSFSLEFSQPVSLLSYDIGFIEFLDGDEVIQFTSSGTSIENAPFVLGSRSFDTAITGTSFAVNTSGANTDDLIQFSSITVETIPEPSSALLLGLGALGMVARRKRIF